MKKIATYILLVGLTLFLFAGCPNPLRTNLLIDFVITLGRFNPTANSTIFGAAGSIMYVPVTISEQTGQEASGEYDVTFTLSVDNDLSTDGDNEALGTISVTAGSEQIVELTVPTSVVAGAYTLFAAAAITGDDAASNNNTASIDVTIGGAAQPNLQITDLNLGSGAGGYLPEATGTLEYKIQNTGFTAIAADTTFTVNFTVNLSAVNIEIGTLSITLDSILYPQDFIIGTAVFTMPTAAQFAADNGETEFSSWQEQLTGTVDSGGVITETNEGDNTATVWLMSGSQKPDLEISSVEIAAGTEYAKAGSPVEFKVTVENNGLAAASGYGVTLFADINTDGTYDAGDTELYAWSAPPSVPFDLITGHNFVLLSVPEETNYPSGITDGLYRVRAVVTGSMEEWDTTNNTSDNGASPWIQFVTTACDLSIDFMSTTLTSAIDQTAGGVIPVTFRIANSSNDAVETDFEVHFYAADNEVLNPLSDTDLGTVSVTGTVPGNGTATETASLTFPGGETIGFYTLYWDVDSTDTVYELDEGNNLETTEENCFVFFPVSDGAADLNGNYLLYNPAGSSNTYLDMDWYLRDSLGALLEYDTLYGSAAAGELTQWGVATVSIPVGDNILEAQPWGGTDDYPYALRIVPDYVTGLPAAAIPAAVSDPDGYESNDSLAAASPANPLFGFINAYLEEGGVDFYSFTF